MCLNDRIHAQNSPDGVFLYTITFRLLDPVRELTAEDRRKCVEVASAAVLGKIAPDAFPSDQPGK